jgi:hypothetical protein
MKEKVAHLVVRVPKAGQQLAAIIAQHQDVITKCGFVWFGVQGARMAPARASLLIGQIKRKTSTYLYVVQRREEGFAAFRAKITAISETLPESDLNHVPRYYVAELLLQGARGWYRVEHFEDVDEEVLNSLSLYVNEKSVVRSLKKGMSSIMMVSEP